MITVVVMIMLVIIMIITMVMMITRSTHKTHTSTKAIRSLMQLRYSYLKKYTKITCLKHTGDVRKHNLLGGSEAVGVMTQSVKNFLDPGHDPDHHQNLMEFKFYFG